MKNDYSIGEKDVRPWGAWEVIYSGQGYIIKRIEVDSGEKLSLQYHNHRSEIWVVVSGSAKATIGEELRELSVGESIHLPVGVHHNIENSSDEPLVFIEIQMGKILKESDIVRLEDKYGRV